MTIFTDADNEKEEDHNKVTLMTIHSAKGLEFRQIFLAGLEEELFPSQMSTSLPKDLEEERRLFYVAVTRAKERVTISYAGTRYRWGLLTNCNPAGSFRRSMNNSWNCPLPFQAKGNPAGEAPH